LIGQVSSRQTGVSHYRRAALGHGERCDIETAVRRPLHLAKTDFLRLVDGEQRIVDLRETRARILGFNQANQVPDDAFAGVGRRKPVALEAPSEALAETHLC